MDPDTNPTFLSLSNGIERRKRQSATFRAFVMLHVANRRSEAPTAELRPVSRFDVGG